MKARSASIDELTKELDALLARMQSPKPRTGAAAAFAAGPAAGAQTSQADRARPGQPLMSYPAARAGLSEGALFPPSYFS